MSEGMTRTTYNPNKFMIFYKDYGLFETELMSDKEVKDALSWQKKGGFDASEFIVCHYDYMTEEFFNDDHTINITDINKGVMKDRVLTEFKARFFPDKLTKQLDMAPAKKKHTMKHDETQAALEAFGEFFKQFGMSGCQDDHLIALAEKAYHEIRTALEAAQKPVDVELSQIASDFGFKKAGQYGSFLCQELIGHLAATGHLRQPLENIAGPPKPRILGSFKNHQDWVNRATRELAHFKHEYGHKVDAMCVDSLGRRCTCGGDFMRARDENTFPVYYFIDCEPPNDTQS